MKNKKIAIIVSIVVLVIVAIMFGVHKFYSSYMFNEDGTISNTSNENFITNVQKIENEEERIMMINFGVEHGVITEKEAEEMLKSK